jgi:hypothetical protein
MTDGELNDASKNQPTRGTQSVGGRIRGSGTRCYGVQIKALNGPGTEIEGHIRLLLPKRFRSSSGSARPSVQRRGAEQFTVARVPSPESTHRTGGGR